MNFNTYTLAPEFINRLCCPRGVPPLLTPPIELFFLKSSLWGKKTRKAARKRFVFGNVRSVPEY